MILVTYANDGGGAMMMMMLILHRLPYRGIIGGVAAMRREQFYKINGYSNKFFGWGGEDDDLYGRWVVFHVATDNTSHVFSALAIPCGKPPRL